MWAGGLKEQHNSKAGVRGRYAYDGCSKTVLLRTNEDEEG
jgi:hypothetical protein